MSVHRRAPQSPKRHGSPYRPNFPSKLAPPRSPTPNNPGGRDRLDVRSPTPPFGWNAPRSSYAPRYPSPLSPGIWRHELAESIKDGKAAGGAPSICVLDTNTLISAWEFLASLYDRLLHLTTQSFLHPSDPTPPFVIVIPYFVMNELDGLKGRHDIGHRVRAANKWILWAVEDQQKSRQDPYSRREVELPPERWPIQAQTKDAAMEMGDRRGGSVDEALVELCKRLQRDTGMPLMFCSNDTNARTRAAIERIRTFDLNTVLDCINRVQRNSMSPSFMRNEATEASHHAVDGPSILLEQWGAQLGLPDIDYRPHAPGTPTHELPMEETTTPTRQSSVVSTDEDESMGMASDASDSRDTLRVKAMTPTYSASPPTGPRAQSQTGRPPPIGPRAQSSQSPPTGLRIQNGRQPPTQVGVNAASHFSSPSAANRPVSLAPPPWPSTSAPSSASRASAAISGDLSPAPPPGPPPGPPPRPPPSSPPKPIANKRKDAAKLASSTGPKRGSAASIHAPPSPTSSRAAVRSTPYPRPERTKGPSDAQRLAVPATTANGRAAPGQADKKVPASGPVRPSATAASSSSSSGVPHTRATNPTSAAKAAAAAAAMVAALSGESDSGRGARTRAGRSTRDSVWATGGGANGAGAGAGAGAGRTGRR